MNTQNWTALDPKDPATYPPEGEVVDTMDSGGNVQQLLRQRNLFWFPDMSMYVYYVPKFWRKP